MLSDHRQKKKKEREREINISLQAWETEALLNALTTCFRALPVL